MERLSSAALARPGRRRPGHGDEAMSDTREDRVSHRKVLVPETSVLAWERMWRTLQLWLASPDAVNRKIPITGLDVSQDTVVKCVVFNDVLQAMADIERDGQRGKDQGRDD